jgi:GNAT superfamily N-acetyltransferase
VDDKMNNERMSFLLLPVTEEDISTYKKDMQEAFQRGAEAEFGKMAVLILPDKEIDESIARKGAHAYKAMIDGKMLGGAIVSLDGYGKHGKLELLYVKHGAQRKGIGLQIWKSIERIYPDVEAWETITPYFEKRNIHFYINCCGFSAVEFFNPHHKYPDNPDDAIGKDYAFRFEKKMQ